MPKGSPAKREASGFWARYRQKYMHGDGASFAPVVHLYIGMVLFGYTYQVNPRDENAVLMAVSFTFETS